MLLRSASWLLSALGAPPGQTASCVPEMLLHAPYWGAGRGLLLWSVASQTAFPAVLGHATGFFPELNF